MEKIRNNKGHLNSLNKLLLGIVVDCGFWGLHDKELYVNMTKHLSRKPSLEVTYQLAKGEKTYILARLIAP